MPGVDLITVRELLGLMRDHRIPFPLSDDLRGDRGFLPY
jgi:hypothetical protein